MAGPALLAGPAFAFDEVRVNTYTNARQWEPAVAAAPDGSFVVVWASAGQDGDGYGVFGTVFRRGLSAGPEFQVNEEGAGIQQFPSVGMDGQGRFVVGWIESRAGIWSVKVRRYAAFGQPCQDVGAIPLGPEITVAELPDGPEPWDMRMAAVGVAQDGKFGVAWVEPHPTPDADEVKYRLYDAGHVPSPLTPVQVAPRYHTYGYKYLTSPRLAAASWGVFLCWIDNGASFHQILGDLVARRYDWNGQDLDSSTTLLDTWVEEGGTDVAVTPAGTVLLAYRRRQEVPTTDNNVYLVHYGPNGPLHPSAIQVNPGYYDWGQRTYNTGVGVAVGSTDATGPWDAVVVWNLRETVNGAYEDSILARHFQGGLEPTPTSPDATQLKTLSGFAEVLWAQSPIAMHTRGEFKAVWWGGPVGAEIYMRCGKFTQEGEYTHRRCEHDADFDGIAERYDLAPDHKFVGYDLDDDGVSDRFVCAGTKEDCDNTCAMLYPGDPSAIDDCVNVTCRTDNCIFMDDTACLSTKACIDANRENCLATSSCWEKYFNPGQEDQNGDGLGDLCEPLVPPFPPLLYKGEPVSQALVVDNLVGPSGKIVVDNLRDEPDPFKPPREQNRLLMDVRIFELPGQPSGQFKFKTRVTWKIDYWKTETRVREIVQDFPVQQTGTLPVELAWDGNDDVGQQLPAGIYVHKAIVSFVRTKTKGQKTKTFDQVETPLKLNFLDRGNYHVDEDREALLEVSVKDPAGAPNVPIEIVRSPNGVIRFVYGEDFRIPLANVGCVSGDLSDRALCFLDHFKRMFGLATPADELQLVQVWPMPGGDRLVIFDQFYNGFKVFTGRVTVMVTPAEEVVQVYSTLGTPISGPGPAEIQAAHAAFDPVAGLETARAKAGNPYLVIGTLEHVLWPSPSANTFTAVPAVGLRAYNEATDRKEFLAVLDAVSGQLLDYRDLRYDLAYQRIHGTAIHSGMTGHTVHPSCTTHEECRTTHGFGQWGYCSNHFEPDLPSQTGRCVRLCIADSDCQGIGYRCFTLQPDPNEPRFNTELFGYCYNNPQDGYDDFPVYDSAVGWYNNDLQFHRAYSELAALLDDVIEHHEADLGMTNSWDNNGSPYVIQLFSMCECDPDKPCHMVYEYENCGVDGSAVGVSDSRDHIHWAGWYGDLTSTAPVIVGGRNHVVGHEFSHLFMGAANGWDDPPAGRHCLHEGLPVQFGALFAVRQLGTGFTWVECANNPPTDGYIDDRSGPTGPGCLSRYVPYAHRSRFDWLDCDQSDVRWGDDVCATNDDCPYGLCRRFSATERRCTNAPSRYHQTHVFTRLLRIMSLGPTPFMFDGNFEFLGIKNNPVGWLTTARIMHRANTQVSSGTTLKDWMGLVKSSALHFDLLLGRDIYSAALQALGASGFFPETGYALEGPVPWVPYKTDKRWAKIYYEPGAQLAAWKSKGSGDINLMMWDGYSWCYNAYPADTDSGLAVVEYGNWVEVMYRHGPTKQLRGLRVNKLESDCQIWAMYYGYAAKDITPNGAVGVTRHDNRVHVVFADASSGDRLAIAWCDVVSPDYCKWHQFPSGLYKKLIWYTSKQGPSITATEFASGLPHGSLSLFVGVAKGDRHISVLRLDEDGNLLDSYEMPDAYNYPSFRTGAPLGITARPSAFARLCVSPFPFDIFVCTPHYLYLAWKDATSNRVYTSVLKNADPTDVWFTRPVETFYRTTTGVSWTKGTPPNPQITFSERGSDKVLVIHGYGRY